jgi:NDP-sugar pyrophosphorylase family protein
MKYEGIIMLKPDSFFELGKDDALDFLFADCDYVWQAVANISRNVARLVGTSQIILGDVMPGAHISHNPVYIGAGARIEPGAYVLGPAYIGPGVIVRHGAFVRQNVILMSGALLGHASEAKNAIFLPNAYAPHFNYIGDSILGHRVNLGAGTKLSNVGLFRNETGERPLIKLTVDGHEYDTSLTKFGAILGDDVQTGCNAVLNPGCLVGSRSLIYANLSLPKGYYPPNSIMKLRQEIIVTERR